MILILVIIGSTWLGAFLMNVPLGRSRYLLGLLAIKFVRVIVYLQHRATREAEWKCLIPI